MANGDRILRRNDALQITCLDAVTATSDGQWVDVVGYAEGNVHVAGIATATVQVRGYNIGTALPANTVHGFQIGANVTATTDGQLTVGLGTMPRFLKVIVSGHTGGTISAAAIIRNHHG